MKVPLVSVLVAIVGMSFLAFPMPLPANEANCSVDYAAFVTVESLAGSPCFVQTNIPNPKIYINGTAATEKQVRKTGFVKLRSIKATASPSRPSR